MDIYLTYRGQIPSKTSSLDAVWSMRKSFHSQLQKLWGKEPFAILKKWEDSNFAAGAPNFLRQIGDQIFVPFYSEVVGVGVKLEIKLLTGLPLQQAVISSGDLDNRVKRIIDALRAPTQKGELTKNLEPGSRWYCVMDDDSSVKEVTASLAPYLDSSDPSESFVFVRVRTSPSAVTLANLAMLF
ncbi:hypothetical protein [Mesorhizobium sp.]|uniref:hypothetical protein n=1 Tax=Mesorhizobium sp. TaxID=1871066 RepID=UPI000FE2DF3A|nr:hypothetical protein [Mesorhizobium sp.]RWA71387.1 MAG: hypothetical protein EOQ28_19070 [Mesorhizobium sp.]RWC00851.1 MAG: hypothetical protein EOQ57_16480 [Mesorhizobium sp.]RWG83782.1 MAG: hypothetical protein EOQ69_12110 [Mesorhizobium sp.]RWG88313.1 MAG: hypothetical protein EOQ70_11875 [Mesorhizobium sp.]RWK05273.1 MAG: hypothetical protein EOR42_13905 [Mesorhizobium sp.]